MDATAHREIPQRIAETEKIMTSCDLCPRRCGVNRMTGETGYCKLGSEAYCFRSMIGYNEEAELTPSHQIYFAGCSMSCSFCTVSEWNADPQSTESISFSSLSEDIASRRSEGARTLNILGGEPAVSLLGVLRLLETVDVDVRVAWNSSMYYSPSAAELLTGLADVYIADLKCGNADCAESLLDAADYMPIAQQNISNSSSAGDLIVRHLVLPGHYECCFQPAMRWIAETLPETKVSLRYNYVPPVSEGTAPAQYLEEDEQQLAHEFAISLGLNLIE